MRVGRRGLSREVGIAAQGTVDHVLSTCRRAGSLDGRVRPWHAWPALSLSQGQTSRDLDTPWQALLCHLRPYLVLLSDGENIYESSETFPRAIEDFDPTKVVERLITEKGLTHDPFAHGLQELEEGGRVKPAKSHPSDRE